MYFIVAIVDIYHMVAVAFFACIQTIISKINIYLYTLQQAGTIGLDKMYASCYTELLYIEAFQSL